MSDHITMTIASVHYVKQSGTFFDMDYYLHKHIPMVKTLLTPKGLQDFRALRGTSTSTGTEPVYELVAMLSFDSDQEFSDAMAVHGEQILGDIPNFTDIRPAIQLNQVLQF